jgi:hypothetical protein
MKASGDDTRLSSGELRAKSIRRPIVSRDDTQLTADRDIPRHGERGVNKIRAPEVDDRADCGSNQRFGDDHRERHALRG